MPQAENASGRSGGFLRAPAAASSLRAGWRWLVRANRRIEDSWVGDLIGVVSLFGLLWIGLVAAAVFE